MICYNFLIGSLYENKSFIPYCGLSAMLQLSMYEFIVTIYVICRVVAETNMLIKKKYPALYGIQAERILD